MSNKRGGESVPASGKCQSVIIYGILIGLHTHTGTIHHNRQAAAQMLQDYGAWGPYAGPLNTYVLRETTAQAVRRRVQSKTLQLT